MSQTPNEQSKSNSDFKLDRSNLYLEETFTDLKLGIIKRFTPVTPDGLADKSRKPLFVGQTSIETPQGPLPIQGEIRAKELSQACKRFPEVMEKLFQGIVEEVKRLQEEKKSPIIQTPASRIIVP